MVAEEGGSSQHRTFRIAQHVARQTSRRHLNDKRHFRPYRCSCGRYVVGTGDIFYVRSDTYLRNQRKESDHADYGISDQDVSPA